MSRKRTRPRRSRGKKRREEVSATALPIIRIHQNTTKARNPHLHHTRNTVMRPHTTTTMDLLPPSTPPRAAASFPSAAAGIDTKTQGAVPPPSSAAAPLLPFLLDPKEGPPAPVDALTCLVTLPFLFSPFLGPKDCLTMAGLQKVGEEEQVGGGWIGCQRWSAVCVVRESECHTIKSLLDSSACLLVFIVVRAFASKILNPSILPSSLPFPHLALGHLQAARFYPHGVCALRPAPLPGLATSCPTLAAFGHVAGRGREGGRDGREGGREGKECVDSGVCLRGSQTNRPPFNVPPSLPPSLPPSGPPPRRPHSCSDPWPENQPAPPTLRCSSSFSSLPPSLPSPSCSYRVHDGEGGM